MSDYRLIVTDHTGAVAALETCSADLRQAQDRARTWTEIGYQVELWAGSLRLETASAQSE